VSDRPLVATLLYHEVTDDPSASGFQRPTAMPYKHSRNAFARHLDAIGLTGRRPKLVSEIDFSAPGSHLLLTFDDGGKSAVYIAEQLAGRGWKGHFFVTTGRLGSATFVNAADVRAIHQMGHLVGAHSHTHPGVFRSLGRESMLYEWRTSADIVAQTIGAPCVAASVPGGDISPGVLESASDAGFRYCFTSEPTLVPKKVGSCWILGRVCAKTSTTPAEVGRYADLKRWRSALAVRRMKGAVRVILGPLYREYVKRRTPERQS
jgi:peptidoglycan/xylan/chitin deacetylase (PgdA/CDA1 family)